MAYKIVVDAGHGAYEMRSGNGKKITFSVERIFSENFSAEAVINRIVNLLLKEWECGSDD